MAYQTASKSTGYSGNKNRAPAAAAATKVIAGSDQSTVFKTGMWTKTDESGNRVGKSLASVQLKEDVTLPAGSYINLFENEKRADKPNDPDFTINVRTGVLKAK